MERPLLDLLPMLRKSAGVKTDKLDVFGALGILRFNQLLPPFDNPAIRRVMGRARFVVAPTTGAPCRCPQQMQRGPMNRTAHRHPNPSRGRRVHRPPRRNGHSNALTCATVSSGVIPNSL